MSYPPPQDPWGQRPPITPGQQPVPPSRPQPRQRPDRSGKASPARQLVIGVLGIFIVACCGISAISALVPDDEPDRQPVAAPASTRQTTPPPVAATEPESTPVATTPAAQPTITASKAAPKPRPVYYTSCDDVRDAGKAPLRKGQPGYRVALDRDGDGRACESSERPAPGTGGDEDDEDDDGGSSGVYYKNCAAVRAAGKDPIRSGDPGYGRHLDRDGDGVGCE